MGYLMVQAILNGGNKVIEDKIDKIAVLELDNTILVATIELIDSILKTLNDYSRHILTLKFVEKWEVWKIANEENKTEGAIKKTLYKSINYLEEKYKKIKST